MVRFIGSGGSVGTHRSLAVRRLAALLYIGASVSGTVVSKRRGRKGEPFGVRTPFSVVVDEEIGWGAALAAPWPLIVALWRAQASAAESGMTGRRAQARLAVLGAVLLAGAASEPITDDLFAGKLRGYEAILAGLDIVLPSVILAGAATALAADGSRVPQTAPHGQSSTVTSGSVLVSTGPTDGSEKASS